MNVTEAIRIMNTARKHSEPVTDLAIELINMVAESCSDNAMELEAENEKLQTEIEQLNTIIADLTSQIAEKTQKKELKVANPPSQEVLDHIEKNVPKLPPEKTEGKRRGCPPKKKTPEDEAIHDLATEIFG